MVNLEASDSGHTADLRKRVDQHIKGQSRYTKQTKDWDLIYYGSFVNKTDARREEIFLKSGKGRQRLSRMLKESLKK